MSLTIRLAFVIAVLLAAALPARAAELVMVEEKWCEWCQRWNTDIGGIYAKTPEGIRAPLRRVDIHAGMPDDLILTSKPRYTPTFILVDKGREIGRIEGYPGPDFFWGMLQRLMKKLPRKTIAPGLLPKAQT